MRFNSFGDSGERKQARESGKRAPLLSNYPQDANAQAPEVKQKCFRFMRNVSD